MRGRAQIAAELAAQSLVVLDDFVPLPICQRMLREVASGDWVPSGVAAVPGARRRSPLKDTGRSSSTLIACYSPWMRKALRSIERSLFTLFGIRTSHLEPWQVTRYARGDAFDYHLDCGAWRGHPSGERQRTILVYLEQPAQGGATHFRALHRRISPVAGRLVVWNNLLANGNCNHAMIHSGCPVWQGHKTILTTWERERRYIG